MSLPGLESKRLCDCYCRKVFNNLTDGDIDYFRVHNTYSLKTRKVAENAFLQCIQNRN